MPDQASRNASGASARGVAGHLGGLIHQNWTEHLGERPRNGSSSTIFRRTVTRSMPCSKGLKRLQCLHPQRVGRACPKTADERARRQAMTWCFGCRFQDQRQLFGRERVLTRQCARCRWPAARHGTVELNRGRVGVVSKAVGRAGRAGTGVKVDANRRSSAVQSVT